MLALLLATSSPAPAETPVAPTAPEVPTCSALRPTFRVGSRSYPAGSAFSVDLDGETVLVTAHHLLGPGGGLPSQLSGPQVATEVALVTVADAFGGTLCGSSSEALIVPDAQPMGDGTHRDLALFVPKVPTGVDRIQTVERPKLAPRQLATTAPAVGSTLFVATGFTGQEAKTFPAEVVEVSETSLYYRFEDPSLELRATSGAALLDADGVVVGMHLGGGELEDGTLIGAGNPAPAIRQRLEAALTARKK